MEIAERLLANTTYSHEFTLYLLSTMKSSSVDWPVRQLAALALEAHRKGLSREGYPAGNIRMFVLSLFSRLRSQRHFYKRLFADGRQVGDLEDFIYRSKQDDKLTLYRYAVDAGQLMQRINRQTNQVPKPSSSDGWV